MRYRNEPGAHATRVHRAIFPYPVRPSAVRRYVPLLWFEDQRVMDSESAVALLDGFLLYVDYTMDTAWDGLVGSGTLAIFGSVLWAVFKFLNVKFDRRKWID